MPITCPWATAAGKGHASRDGREFLILAPKLAPVFATCFFAFANIGVNREGGLDSLVFVDTLFLRVSRRKSLIRTDFPWLVGFQTPLSGQGTSINKVVPEATSSVWFRQEVAQIAQGLCRW